MSNKYGTGYDIIGDIHGYASELKALLNLLGYEEREGCYRHPERRVIFLGDFIDRGPEIRETLRIVRAMVERGHAMAVMGNHEYNALCYHTPDGNRGYLRSHIDKNTKQHQATLDQIAVPFPDEWVDHLRWFQSLPLYLERDGLRVVHACWDDAEIRALNGCDRLTGDLLFKSAQRTTPEFRAVGVLLKGKEIRLPDGGCCDSRCDSGDPLGRLQGEGAVAGGPIERPIGAFRDRESADHLPDVPRLAAVGAQ